MAKSFLTPINLNKLELQNAAIQNLGSAPSSPAVGQVYFDTTLDQFGCYDGTDWVYLGAALVDAVTRAVDAANAGELVVSGGADKTIAGYTTAGIVKIAAGIAAAAVAGTDYTTPAGAEALTNKTINASSNTITNITLAMLAANVADTDVTLAANSDARVATQKAVKAYVDAIAQGLRWKAPVRAATTAALTLASDFENGDAIDGVTLATGDRILIKDQASGAENGIYIVAASGAPTRTTDADTSAELLGMVVDVMEGTANADTAWVLTNNTTITVNTTALVYVDFIKANVPNATTSIAGKVVLASSAEAEAKSSTTKALTPSSIVNFPIKKTFTIGDNSTTALTVTHNLNTKDVIAAARLASSDEEVICDIASDAVNTTTFTFAVAPATNSIKVVIIG